MANKRMFNLSVVDTDLFLEMPITSRLLYYELGMRADDDGFVDNWKKIMRMAGLVEDDLKVLIAKKFIIPFESGVIVIRHWRLNNYLRNDRHTPTRHKEELARLYVENDVYELENTEKSTMLPDGIPTVYPDKNRIDKNRIDKNRVVAEENKKEEAATAKDEVIIFYLNNINSAITEFEAQRIAYYEGKLPPDLIIYAMEKAVKQKGRRLSYIEKILDTWIANDITTLAEAKEERKPTEKEDAWEIAKQDLQREGVLSDI